MWACALRGLNFSETNPLPFKSFSELKTELIEQGKKYATEALGYRDKIADLSLGFIKDDSVVCAFFSPDLIAWKW